MIWFWGRNQEGHAGAVFQGPSADCRWVAYTVWQNKQPVGLHRWLEIWNRWDGAHYLDIASLTFMALFITLFVQAEWAF